MPKTTNIQLRDSLSSSADEPISTEPVAAATPEFCFGLNQHIQMVTADNHPLTMRVSKISSEGFSAIDALPRFRYRVPIKRPSEPALYPVATKLFECGLLVVPEKGSEDEESSYVIVMNLGEKTTRLLGQRHLSPKTSEAVRSPEMLPRAVNRDRGRAIVLSPQPRCRLPSRDWDEEVVDIADAWSET